MEFLGGDAVTGSSFSHSHHQHRDGNKFENDFPFNSCAELDSLASGDRIGVSIQRNAEEIGHRNMTSPKRKISGLFPQEIEEHIYELTSSPTGEELDASLLLRGEQICSAEFNENGAGYCSHIQRNLDAQSEESQVFSPEEEEREEAIKEGASSCNGNGFRSVPNNENSDPVQEAALESEGPPAGPCDINKRARPYQRDSAVNYILESAKFVTLIGSLLQLPRVLKGWASKTLMKPKMIPTLMKKKVEKNERGNFTSEGPSIREQQHGRGNVCSEDLAGALGFPLGMSIATVLAEILGSNCCLKHSISGEEISELLALAIRESLNKVWGIDCSRLVRDFEVAFTSTFKTNMRVKQVHYQQKLTSYPVEKKMSASDLQMPGLAAVSFVNDAKVEYADALVNLRGNLREKTDCSQIMKQTSGSLHSGQRVGMKGGVHQSCKPSFLKSNVQVTSNFKDELFTENYREEQKSRNCLTETVNPKDRNDLTSFMSSAVNQHTGNVSKPNWEMGVANNEIENISQKLKNIDLDFADCRHSSMESIPSISNVTAASTATSIEQTYCSQLIEQTSGSLGSGQRIGMKGGIHQSCKPSFLKSDAQVTSNSKDELPRENCRVELAEIVNPKDHNVLTSLKSSAVNHQTGNASKRNREMGFANNDSDLACALYETGRTTDMSITCISQQAVLQGQFQRQLAKSTAYDTSSRFTPQSISKVFEKSIMEQQRSNNLREVEIGLTMRRLRLKEAKMCVDAESNELQRQSISMSQSKASFKESKFIDHKLRSAYAELNRTCADHLVAGLVLMLFALAYGSWKYSYAHLSNSIEVCQVPKEPRKSSWFYNPMDSATWHIKALGCGLTVIVRLLLGLAVIGFFACSLLRRTIASSSQTMPATIIVIFLSLICGYAGKLSVDNLGGNGFQWLVQWEFFCLLHALSAGFPASLFCVLNGAVSCHEGVKKKPLLIPLGLRKFIFHIILLVLPIMTGLTPFASVKEWINHFFLVISDNVLEPVRISVRDCLAQFLVV